MENSQIDELCRQIYRRHRQAIDLIIERVKPNADPLIAAAQALIESMPELEIRDVKPRDVYFQIKKWLDVLPPIVSKWGEQYPRDIFAFGINFRDGYCELSVQGGPTDDPETRRKIIRRLTDNPAEFGFRFNRTEITDDWTRIYTQQVIGWPKDSPPTPEMFSEELRKSLNNLLKNTRQVPDAIRHISEEWRNKNK